MTLSTARARTIAKTYLKRANPDGWDGTGEMPSTVEHQTVGVPVNAKTFVSIYLQYVGPEGWQHFCELRNLNTDTVIASGHGPGVNDIDAIAKTLTTMMPLIPVKRRR